MSESLEFIAARLRLLFDEMRAQKGHVMAVYASSARGFDLEFEQLGEYIDDANELGIAYEVLVCNLEFAPYVLTAQASLAILELGLLFGFRTERPCDEIFDRRADTTREP